MLLPSWESWCTCALQRWLCRAKSLQCLVSSTFLLCQLNSLHLISPYLQLSSAFHVHYIIVNMCICVWMFVLASMRVCACVFIEISGNTVGNYKRNLQQCHVSLSFSDSLLCYLQVVCVQLQISYICLNLLCLSSFPWLAQNFLWFLYKVFVFSQREWFWGGGKTEVPTCPVGQRRNKSRSGQTQVLLIFGLTGV